MIKTYTSRSTKEKLKEFNRCVEARIFKLRQKHLESQDYKLLTRLKPMPESNSCDLQIKLWEQESIDKLEVF